MRFGDQERPVRLIPSGETAMEIDAGTQRRIDIEWMKRGMERT